MCIIINMSAISELRTKVDHDVLDYQVISGALAEYRKPADRIKRMIDDEELVRVKRGLYVFGRPFRRRLVSREYLANLIFGPSYVSLQSALAFHGLIPENVEAVTSVTTGRNHEFETSFGTFTYAHLSESRYVTGVYLHTRDGDSFLIATPEKALVDTVWTDKRVSGITLREFEPYLFDDLRLDSSAVASFDRSLLIQIERAYDSAKISQLVKFLTQKKALRYE